MSFSSSPSPATASVMALILLLIIASLPSPAMTQPNSPIIPTIAECGPRIIPLAMCAPFVQGVSTEPSQSCCDSLRRVNDQQPQCLCLLLNNSVLSSAFPVNTTLAMRLPSICSVHFETVSCTDTFLFRGGAPLPSISPTPQVSLGSTTNSTVASSPMTRVIPKFGLMGLGYNHNYAMKYKGSSRLMMLGIVTCISSSILY